MTSSYLNTLPTIFSNNNNNNNNNDLDTDTDDKVHRRLSDHQSSSESSDDSHQEDRASSNREVSSAFQPIVKKEIKTEISPEPVLIPDSTVTDKPETTKRSHSNHVNKSASLINVKKISSSSSSSGKISTINKPVWRPY